AGRAAGPSRRCGTGRPAARPPRSLPDTALVHSSSTSNHLQPIVYIRPSAPECTLSVVEEEMAPSAYVVLGLLEVNGPGTPYDLKRWVDESIGYFWSFPRAQLYVEPARLAGKGLVTEARESEGRRRRVYRITEAGRQE